MRPALITVRWLAMLMPVLGSAADLDEAAVKALEQRGEQAREANLKPWRDAEIARCKESEHSDPGYCERFWHDYGGAARLANGTFRPRMFDDLPECTAAREARRKLNFE